MNIFKQKWIVSECNRKMCDCRVITTENEDLIISDGAVDSQIANYIVSLHNGNPYKFDLKKWKTKECISGASCWCRLIVDENDKEIVDYGAISKPVADYIINLHNTFLENHNETF